MDERRQLSLKERWEIDKRSGATYEVSSPQCKKCKNILRETPLQCLRYTKRKPGYVLKCKKECEEFIHQDYLHIDVDSKNRNIISSILGFIVGDIVGVPVEFESRDKRKEDPVQEMRAYGTYHQPFGTWSDDTSLMLCLIDSLIKGYDLDDICKEYIQFYIKGLWTPYGEVFDIGNTTRAAIERMIQRIDPLKCGGTAREDNGNGSLMRILPVAFYVISLNNQEKLKIIEEISSLTHAHKRSKLACIIYVEYVIQLMLTKDKNMAYIEAIRFVNENCMNEYVDEIPSYKRIFDGNLEYEEECNISSSGYVVDTLEAALWCFLTTDTYKEAILKAVNLGEDTDTIAAITGGLAGMLYEYESIPNNWLQCIAKKREIYKLINVFAANMQKSF